MTEEEAGPAGLVYDREKKRVIHSHGHRFGRLVNATCHSMNRRGGCPFCPFLVHVQERFVKDIRDRQIILWSARSNAIEVGASFWDIECAFHAESLQGFSKRKQRRS